MPAVVANADLTWATGVHLLLLVVWAVVLLPLGAALRSRYGALNGCGRMLHLAAALASVVGLVVWLPNMAPSSAAASSSASASSSSAAAAAGGGFVVAALPETLYVGGVVAAVCAAQCAGRCCPAAAGRNPWSAAASWAALLVAGTVLPMVAFDQIVGSCGGKIVASYKKGYEVFDSVPEDLCTAHFSYLALAAALLLSGAAWHKVAEEAYSHPRAATAAAAPAAGLRAGLEHIFMCVLGIVLLVFRGATVGAVLGNGESISLPPSGSGGPFFGNTGGLQDGVLWGRVAAAAVCLIVFGVFGCCCHGVRLLSSLPVPMGMFALGVALAAVGSAPTDTYFGHPATYDADLASMQATFLLAAGLLAVLAAAARMVSAGLTCCCGGGSESGGTGAASIYYAVSLAAVSMMACGGFVLLAQPAATQLLGRELGMGAKGGATCVCVASVLAHMLFRIILALVTGDEPTAGGAAEGRRSDRRRTPRSSPRRRAKSPGGRGGKKSMQVEMTRNAAMYNDDGSEEEEEELRGAAAKTTYRDEVLVEDELYGDVEAV
jgi:hypothetical protein